MRSQLVHQISELLPADSCPHTTARSSTTVAWHRAAGSCRPTFRGIIRGKPYVITAWPHSYNIFRAYYSVMYARMHAYIHTYSISLTTPAATGPAHYIVLIHPNKIIVMQFNCVIQFFIIFVGRFRPPANTKYCNHNRNRASACVRPCDSGGYRYGKYLTFIIDSTFF